MKAKRAIAGRKARNEGAEDRRTTVAEAALRVLAEQGARGLTHRAVDAEARLPLGSTSYCCRTRDALVAAAASRLCELDKRDVERASRSGGIRALLGQWGSPRNHWRLVARFELFLDATRNGRTRKLIRQHRGEFVESARQALARAGIANAAVRGELLVATVDGLLLAHLIGPKQTFEGSCRQAARDIIGLQGRPERRDRAR